MANSRFCVACKQHKPAKQFLPSPLNLSGHVDKCLDCIRRAAENFRIEREQRVSAAEARDAERVEAARAIAQSRLAESRALTIGPAVRPLKARIERIEPHLIRAASRFVSERQRGQAVAIQEAIEPELHSLLVWLHEQTLKEAANPRTPEEIGREILGYRDDRICRGITYGALWAALVRCAAIYTKEDEPAQQKLRAGIRSRRS
jgi:hypothetical protein